MAVACIFMPLYSVIAITEQVKQKKKDIYLKKSVFKSFFFFLYDLKVKVYLKEKKKQFFFLYSQLI